MPRPVRSRLTVRVVVRRFRKNRKGSAAVEFALIMPLFVTLLIAIIELGLIFFAGQFLEAAVQDTARLIMTGQAQMAAGSGYTADQFKQKLCEHLTTPIDCSNLSVDVQSFPQFSGINPGSPTDANNNLKTKFLFSMGDSTSTVVVRAFYPWQLLAARLFNIATLADGKYLLQASAAFRNEPYQ